MGLLQLTRSLKEVDIFDPKTAMFKQFLVVYLLLLLGTSVLLIFFENKLKVSKQASPSATDVSERTEKQTVSPPFVYLTQTEQCLRSKIIQNLELSNSSKCRCDVIVLSYKKECLEESPPHFTYLFDNTTTWGSGRNELFFHAMDKRLAYIYYIFLDDDVSLKFNAAATSAMTSQLSPIRSFQNWLLEYEPAVGVVDYKQRREGETVLRRKRKICHTGHHKADTPLAYPTIFFDPVFNAFHAKAVSHIFPLDTRHEKINWWLTDKYITSAVELKFRGQALLFFPVTVENPLHRPYPRSVRGRITAWQGFIEDIQRQSPAQYANHSLFKEFKRDPDLYVATSRTYCMNISRKQDIVPFAHFSSVRIE